MSIRPALAAALLVSAACSGGGGERAAATSTTVARSSTPSTSAPREAAGGRYGQRSSWLCRPDMKDACEDDMDATVVDADGRTAPDRFEPAEKPPIDCFYVYPTVSRDPGANSDMIAGPDEENVVRAQAARFASACSLYAPMYRSATLTALQSLVTGGSSDFFNAYTEAYNDVLAAWRYYLAHDNRGRGVIIIGHSQGSSHLLKLLEEEIDPNPAQRALLVSAMLMGTSAHESELPHVPPCRRDTQTGCIISYSTFRDTAPPPPGAFFARPTASGERAICTNPASLRGGSGALEGYFPADGWGVTVKTPWVRIPGLVTGECKDVGGFNHLSITVRADPGPRVDDVRGGLTPEWGMHVIDVSVAEANLVAIARAEGRAYRG